MDVTGKRKRKPNIRYVDDANLRLDNKVETLLGTEVTETFKTSTQEAAGTTGQATRTDQKTKKSRKRMSVQYEVNCSDITGLDINAFVCISILLMTVTVLILLLLLFTFPLSVLFQQCYLKSEMKVAGKKNCPSLKVVVRGLKVIIQSKLYVPKKSLRYSARKYFKDKKMNHVCVSNESKNSYKLTSQI